MDIASRLKQFMATNGIASSQFADNADIPRPTLSQLLNGRNKKTSNELIAKIHEAYPELNVLWLMFGEGDMEYDANFKTSRPQKAEEKPASTAQEPRYEAVYIAQSPDYNNPPRKSNYNSAAPEAEKPANERPISAEAMQALSNAGARIADSARVQQIMVLYTDGRFETFTPAD